MSNDRQSSTDAPQAESSMPRSARRLRRLSGIGLLGAVIGALILSQTAPASASVVPVTYTTGALGPIHCYTTTGFADGSSYAYLDVAPPTRVVDYTGTYNVYWVAQVYEWVNGRWAYTGVYDGAAARGSVHTAGWLQVGYWTGPEGNGDLELTATHGAYFSVIETTAWYNAAGRQFTSYANASNVAAC